jgi:hypothetical protein
MSLFVFRLNGDRRNRCNDLPGRDDQENQWTSSWNSYKAAIITISYHRMGVVDKSRAEERVSEHLRVKY